MTAKPWLLVVVTAALLLSAAACSRGRSDAQIAGEVVTRINGDPQVTNKQISVTSNGGVVTLSGPAASEAERAAAANDAAQVEGVKTVVNNLVAAAAPAPAEQAAAEPAPEPPAPVRRHKPTAYHARARAVSAPAETPVSTVTETPAPAPVAAAPIPSPPPEPPKPPKPVTIPSGTTLSVRMIDSVDTGRNHPGDMFHASLYAPLTVDDQVVIPEGADITGRVADLKDAGHFAGQPQLALELVSVSMNGRSYTLTTDQYTQRGASRGSSTAKTVGSGAAIGAIIGAIAGGGKGAAIGAAAGAGMGGGVQAARKPPQVHIAPEALLSFRLQSPLTVTPAATIERHRLNSNWSAPPPRNHITDYSDSSNSSPDRPVLRRRPPEDNQPPQE
jgi:hypothetical protein